jgi:uncharacterized protein (TIGR02996 family)
VSDGEALIRSILTTPADDAPRLVYADWLDEQGRAEDAEFIRVQVELARLGFGGAFYKDESGRLRHMPPHVERLTERQLELWFSGYGKPDLPDDMITYPMTVHQTPGQNLLIRRGFVERVTIFTDLYLLVAGGLFARQPVTHVRLVDLVPLCNRRTGTYGWEYMPAQRVPGRSHQVPVELSWYFPEEGPEAFATADEAEAALSWACVRFGRAAAGLTVEPEGRP